VARNQFVWHSRRIVADSDSIEVTIGPQGRIVVPAPLRRHLGFQPGEVLVARAEQGRLVLERREAVFARLRDRFALVPADVDLAAELIGHRREESVRESGV